MCNRPQRAYVLLLALLPAPSLVAKERSIAEAQKVAQRVLSRAIVIDTHADTPQMMLDDGYDLADPNSTFMISIPKMQKGHFGAEFLSIWVDSGRLAPAGPHSPCSRPHRRGQPAGGSTR